MESDRSGGAEMVAASCCSHRDEPGGKRCAACRFHLCLRPYILNLTALLASIGLVPVEPRLAATRHTPLSLSSSLWRSHNGGKAA